MNCLPFKFQHYELITDMLKAQKSLLADDISYQILPKIGYICIYGKQAIAAGFLRRVEGGFGQLDTFVTNPYFGSKLRNQAINAITDCLLEDAKSLKMLGIILTTSEHSIQQRAKERGFIIIDAIIMGKRL